jgi:hypothetical protein
MQIVFLSHTDSAWSSPGPGDIQLRPRLPEHPDQRRLACLVLDEGLTGLAQGEPPLARIVIRTDATLDEMLAATFVEQLAGGHALPAGARAFATYAAMAREGLKPGDLPLKESLVGIFKAICRDAGDLTNPVVAERFVAEWQRISRRILEAAASGKNPLTTQLFSGDPEFARAQAFLANDADVYHLQDVPRSKRWLVSIPGGPPHRVSGLLVGSPPQSCLWKYWCREDPEAPGKKGYVFLAFLEKPGHWVFSTNPIHRLPIASLAAQLQKAEAAKDPERAARDPWFDGKPFEHTLVAAPKRGSLLDDRDVLRIVKKWGRVRRYRPGRSTWKYAAAVAAAVLLTGTVLELSSGSVSRTLNRGVEWVSPKRDRAHVPGTLFVLSIGISNYKCPPLALNYADNDAKELNRVLRELKGGPFREVVAQDALTNSSATRTKILDALKSLAQEARNAGPEDLVVVSLAGHGETYNKHFYFLSYDWDPDHELDRVVSWDDLKMNLSGLRCTVVILMDACHSGAVTRDELWRSEDRMVVLAACSSNQVAQEHPDWKHGAFTKAVMEGLTGDYQLAGMGAQPLLEAAAAGTSKFITLKELDFYVTQRVEDLAGKKQTVISNNSGDLPVIYLGMRKPRAG